MQHDHHNILGNRCDHFIKHLNTCITIFNDRILLCISLKRNTLSQLIHIVNMAHPLIVNDFQQEDTLYLTECLRRTCFLCNLLFFLRIQIFDLFCYFINQTIYCIPLIIILVHG